MFRREPTNSSLGGAFDLPNAQNLPEASRKLLRQASSISSHACGKMSDMSLALRRGRGLAVLGTLLVCMLLALCPPAFALDPSLDLSQYAHKAWTIREGFFKSAVTSVAQTTDGYFWLGTEFGLLRFDGVKTSAFEPPRNQELPSNAILSLLAARDGTLWIGTANGLVSWKGGKLTRYAELDGLYVNPLLEDREGSVWAGGVGPRGKLCTIETRSTRCYGDDGSFGRGSYALFEDSKGNVWISVSNGIWRWKPGPPQFYPVPGALDSITGLSENKDGALLIGSRNGIQRFVNGKLSPYPLPGVSGYLVIRRLLHDRDGALWIGTRDHGLVHLHQGRTDIFAQSDGLSDGDVHSLFEDREGNIWVITSGGLDRFRGLTVSIVSLKQGLSNAVVQAGQGASDGSVWLSTEDGLDRSKNGEITIYRTRAGSRPGHVAQPAAREIIDDGLPDNGMESMFQDDRGRIWISTLQGTAYLEDGRFVPVKGVPGGVVHHIVGEAAGNLWINHQAQGLFHVLDRKVVEQIPWARLGHQDHATALVSDRARGGLWLGFATGGVSYLAGGQLRTSYTTADGLGQGRVTHLQLDNDGTLWASTGKGLSRLKNGRIATLGSKNGLPCDTVHWSIEDDARSLWLYMPCGLVRIARSELAAWTAAVDNGNDAKRTIQVTVLDSTDGIRMTTNTGGYSPLVTKSTDGKLWIAGVGGASVLDPAHLPFNSIPPPVLIEQVVADRKTYNANHDGIAAVRLPPRIRDLEIDYTAFSFVAPEKVRFRFKLEGYDRDWQDAGNRRQAFYTNLPPRNYRFRVMAANNSGVWNEAGTFLDFSIAPAYYQTDWFRLSIVVAVLASLAALYRLRLRQVARQFNIRLEERVQERTRIARDLHDTLLQSFQGVLLRFHTVSYLLVPDRLDEARNTLESVIEQARDAVTEGRDAVQGLRSLPVINNLAAAISTLGEELAADHAGQNRPDFRVQVEGTSRDLAPFARDETYRIAIEAVRNAFRHAHASRIEVDLQYDKRQLRLRVRDNGKGMDPKFLSGHGKEGHYGLTGMHERAKAVGGKMAVWSKLDSGTEAELTIPASIAYTKSPTRSRPMSSEKGT